MNFHLSQKQRILVAFLYLLILGAIFLWTGAKFGNLVANPKIDASIWFYSGVLMIILGAYIVEPYFSTPADAIANSIALLISLNSLNNPSSLKGFKFIFIYALIVLLAAILSITLKDAGSDFLKKVAKILFKFVENFGKSKWMFSVVYLSASYSFFATPDKILGSRLDRLLDLD